MTEGTCHPSPLGLAVLAMLREAPMHPYRMQQLIKQRGKDQVINVQQRTGIYQTIDRLLRSGLIEVRETMRDENRPERTVYGVTEAGRAASEAWLRQMLAVPSPEFPEFPAALALIAVLPPAAALQELEARAAALEAAYQRDADAVATVATWLPRLFLLEHEYVQAMRKTELGWVCAVIEDLRAKRLTWSEAWLRKMAEKHAPQEDAPVAPRRRRSS